MSDFSPISESRALQRLPCALATWREKTVLNTVVVAQVIFVGCLIAQSGCIGYQVGAGSLYAPDVATVYVPMIESDSYRRDLGERLTEAVCKEIELKTPYKVVSTPDADSILSVR